MVNDAVAPRVGAWIETTASQLSSKLNRSHPEWVRGLKHGHVASLVECLLSHPEWVRGLKLKYILHEVASSESHPEWVRGLKLHTLLLVRNTNKSHPEWVRGLKLYYFCICHFHNTVASRVGAWIETNLLVSAK